LVELSESPAALLTATARPPLLPFATMFLSFFPTAARAKSYVAALFGYDLFGADSIEEFTANNQVFEPGACGDTEVTASSSGRRYT